MNTKKTVNAFTLVEMVIVLIIASLIVALSFTVLDIVQRNLGNISKQFSVENNRILLQSRLEANFLKYGESYYDRNKEQIVFRNNIDSIIYRLNNDFLIMEDDTIDFKFQKIYFYDLYESSKTDQIWYFSLFFKSKNQGFPINLSF